MIRRLVAADAASFRELRLLGLERHPEAFATGADAWRDPDDAAVIAAMGAEGDPSDRFVLGSFEEDRIVGVIGFKREVRASLRHKGTLWGLLVHPERRRRGHGGALLDAALARLRDVPELAYVRIVVTTADDAALRVFRSRGFVRYAVETGGLRVGGSAFDQTFLRLDL
jgi:ribosomal protein S18 acetylase RimI-like enzyme